MDNALRKNAVKLLNTKHWRAAARNGSNWRKKAGRTTASRRVEKPEEEKAVKT
jgi:GH24 family phage-related lysozyme (muramidase)